MATALAAMLACSPRDPGGGAKNDKPDPGTTVEDAPAPSDATVAVAPSRDGAVRKTMKCEQAREAIEARNFVGWTGLPEGCTTDALFGVPFSGDWSTRSLGSVSTPWYILDLDGYYRPMVSARDGKVVLFDAMTPELAGGWGPLAADLGEPAAKLDWHFGTLAIASGEWVYPARGITVFLNTDASKALHVAVFTPATLDEYRASLRPNLEKKPLPYK